jgi:iron complex outermembrane receptor protein
MNCLPSSKLLAIPNQIWKSTARGDSDNANKGVKGFMKKHLLVGAAAIAAFSFYALPGHRALGQSPASPTATPSGDLDEIVVTAQRRSQNIQDVPIAISSFSAKDIQQLQINDTTDIARLVPNFFFNNNTGAGSGNVYFLRGLGQTESFSTFDPQVATYVDDIYIGRESASNFGLFDVDQLQVLRGPQGTLFGRNATGGAIVISLAKPSNDFGGYIDLSYGEYNMFSGRASVSLPISEELLTKTSAYGVRDDGYVDDVATGQKLNGHNDYGLREAILVRPAGIDNLVWNASIDYSDSNFNENQNFAIGGKRISYSGYGVLSSPIAVIGGPAVVSEINGVLKEPFSNLANEEDLLTWGAMSNVELAFDPGTLNFITGVRAQRQLAAGDFPFPGASGPVVPYDDNYLGQFGIALNSLDLQYSQEIKWSGKAFDEKLTYTGGLFYLYERNSTDFIETLTLAGLTPPGTVFGLALSAPQHYHNTTSSAAGFLQGDYAVMDELTFTAGGRFTHEEKNYTAAGNPALGGYDTEQVAAAGNRTGLRTDQFTPHFALDYKITPDVMVFATVTRGFQGGGWNSLTGSAALVNGFGPETIWTYETGLRSETDDKKLRFNADFFYNDIRNYQLPTLGPGSASSPNFITENAAGLITYGFEADVAYKPIDDLTISATLGLENGYYQNPNAATAAQQLACKAGNTADCGQGIVNLNGNLAQPEDFPPLTFTLTLVYDWTFDQFTLTPIAGVQFMQANHVDTSGLPAGLSPSHYLLDLGMTFKLNDADWTLTAECKNCTMTNYQVAELFVPYYNNPGTWDVKVHLPFGGAHETAAAPAAYTPPPVQAPMPASVAHSYMVFFDFNKSDLTPQAVAIVDQAAKNAGPAKATELVVTGHTDTVGSDAYNMRLSRRRAESVAAEIEKMGIKSSEIEIVAKGKTDLLVPTKDGVREPQNRRVTIVYGGGMS